MSIQVSKGDLVKLISKPSFWDNSWIGTVGQIYEVDGRTEYANNTGQIWLLNPGSDSPDFYWPLDCIELVYSHG